MIPSLPNPYSRIPCIFAISSILISCSSTLYVPPIDANNKTGEEVRVRQVKFPSESDRIDTVSPPKSLDEAYRQQYAKCFAVERERDRQATAVSAARYSTGVVGILLTVVGTGLVAYAAREKAENETASTGGYVSVGSSFAVGGIVLSSIAGFVNFERRVDANRRHREAVRRVMMNARAQWYGEGGVEELNKQKVKLLKDMAETCSISADVESRLDGEALKLAIQEASEETKTTISKGADANPGKPAPAAGAAPAGAGVASPVAGAGAASPVAGAGPAAKAASPAAGGGKGVGK